MEQQHYNPKEREAHWQRYWEDHKIYKFDENSKKPIFSIDTPPPTVSGKMHMGHACSFSQADFVARYKRMKGFNMFYPFGTDDNGLATNLLIEKLNKVKSSHMERQAFIDLCLKTLDKLRPEFVSDWKKIAVSADYDLFYSTIDNHSRTIAQRSFIDLYNQGREYRKEAPTIWCPHCETAIAQVEMQDAQLESSFNDIAFTVDGKELLIATTRPELLSACVAVFYHPEDKRYQKYKEKKAKVPVYGHEVPILADERVDMNKGTGIVMCCTFGDQTDIEWYKAYRLPLRQAITKDGRTTELAGKFKRMKIKEARNAIIEDMRQQGLLKSQKKITHAVNVHERCGTEVEILNSRQWFIKYLDLKEEYLNAGKEINWYPAYMRQRYDNWVKGLQWDWCISRQRYFGIPFPVWYCTTCGEVKLAELDQLPVDPLKDKPRGTCGKCNGTDFEPEKDVFDTWATSSLTPQLAGELVTSPVKKKLFPMSLRPQAHDIITFWLFNTVVKSHFHFKKNPWKDAMISGWVLDPYGKKMSKSKGNVIAPQELMIKYSADALRFWAASTSLGEDVSFQEKEFVAGTKFVNKLWNASKFCFMHLQGYDGRKPQKLDTIDWWILSKLQKLIEKCSSSFEQYEYNTTKLECEKFFMHAFCDNYLEIVKDRLYNVEKRGEQAKKSAQYTLYHVLLTAIKLMAPIMPHITEEVYQAYFAEQEGKKSVHISEWPTVDKKLDDNDAEKTGDITVDIIGAIRKYKSQKGASLKEGLNEVVLECTTMKDFESHMLSVEEDLKAVIHAQKISFGKGGTLTTEVFEIGVGVK